MPNGNGKSVAALRITPAPPSPDEAAVIPLEEELPPEETGAGGFELVGPAKDAFKEMLGHECKVGDTYTLQVTATDVTPGSIAFSIDSVESEYEEEPVPTGEEDGAAPAAPAEARTPAMTYA